MSQTALLRERRFGPLFWTQFQAAFNDNFFKNALVILITFRLAAGSGAGATGLDAKTLSNISLGLFILPYFIFSATAGQMADKYEKSRLIRWVKFAEIIIMLLACAGFYLNNVFFLLAVLFGLGTQATIFGPVKYSILPQVLKEEELIGGNGLIELGTFVSILIGTILGGILILQEPHGKLIVCAVLVLASTAGWLCSCRIPIVEPTDPSLKINWNPISQTYKIYQFTRENRTIYLSILGISWFWLFGAMFLSLFPTYCTEVLDANEQVVTLFLAMFSIGIGIGSASCEKLSEGKIELGLVPFGSIGMTVFTVDLFLASFGWPHSPLPHTMMGAMEFLGHLRGWRIIFDLLMFGVFGGFYIVPLYTLIQKRSEPSHRSRIIAGNNIINALFMVISAGITIVLLKMGMSIPQVFLVGAIMNAVVALYIYNIIPEFLIRFIMWMLVHSIYKLQREGVEQLPEEGPAILVCNHVTFVDGLVISAAFKRPIRFIVERAYAQMPVVGYVYRKGKAIPVVPAKEDPAALDKAMDAISAGLKAGDVICIFPEGKLTTNGDMGEFKKGIERIVARDAVPVIPMALRGLWGSYFSRFYGGKAMSKFPKKIFFKIGLRVGQPVPPSNVTAAGLHKTVAELRGDWK